MVIPKLSIIIPVYNERPYLKRCFDSILKQLTLQVEVIVVDDCSTDGSRKECLERFYFTKIFLLKNMGVSAARNVGIEAAKGEYITFLDADDEYIDGAIKTMLEAVSAHPEANIIQFNHLRHYAALKKTVKKYDNPDGWHDISDLGNFNHWFGVWNKVFRNRKKEYLFNESLRYGEDGVFVLEQLLNGDRVLCVDKETVIHHFENPKSLTKSKTKDQVDALELANRELLAKHCSPKEPWAHIRALVDIIEEDKGKL